MEHALSVVIPTYNRVETLMKTLESLIHQTLYRDLFEIIVVDDGSLDETKQRVSQFKKYSEHHIHYLRQENQSAASARNLGIRKAKAALVLLMDSDIVLNDNHLNLHLALHQKYPEPEIAVRGRIVPGREGVDLLRGDGSDISPVRATPDGEMIVSADYFVTADVSLKKEFMIRAGLFTPGLLACQDADLARRLQALGLELIYCRKAVAHHMEPLDTVQKVIENGQKYGRVFAEWYDQIALFQKEIWRLGGRFNGGWDHFIHHPWGYLKDAIRRWMINTYTIEPIILLTLKIPITNPPKGILVRCCKEIWSYYYRSEFKKRQRELSKLS